MHLLLFRLALTNRGKLYEFCQYSRALLPSPIAIKENILGFNLMINNDDVELLVLAEAVETRETNMKIFDFPCELHEHFSHSKDSDNLSI